MLLTRLELDPLANIRKLPFYCAKLGSKQREELIYLVINKNSTEENINERISALYALRDRLEKSPDNSPQKSLTDKEVQKLYHLITDEAEFPIVIYPDEFTVEEITHEKNHEDSTYKLKITKDIEQNDALLRAEAALLIVDFGQNTKKYNELKHRLATAITAILGNMLGEPHDLFLKELEREGNQTEQIPSMYFTNFVEALYFIDKKAAEHFIKIFNININDFNLERRNKKL